MKSQKRRLAMMVTCVWWVAPGWANAATDLENGVPVTGLSVAQSDITDLVSGQTVANLSGSQDNWDYFRIAVPSDVTSLQVVISGGSGDADLFTRFAALPTTDDYDCRSYNYGNDETCSYNSPSSGDYYIGLQAYSSYSGVSLTATYSTDGGGGGAGTFIVSAVNDNLDNTDMTLMANGLINLGYTQQTFDTNVYTSEMISYLQRSITTYYHTGHGDNGTVMTYDGSINSNSTTINVVNTYFATCLTLTDTNWKNAFGPNAENVMGYTQLSYDFIDEDVVNTIIDELGVGTSYPMSWYLANAGISSLQDRWAAYSRQGSSIVEYSARTDNIPSTSLESASWEALGDSGRLWIASEVLQQENMLKVPRALRSLQAEPSAVFRYVAEGDIGLLGPTALTQDEAVATAETWLSDAQMLPIDAELDRVVELGRRSEPTQAKEVVGHMVIYARSVDGMKVRGNRLQDHIVVLVGPDSVISVSSYWPSLSEIESDLEVSSFTLEPWQAVALAAPQIDRILKSASQELFFVDIEPVLGTAGPYAANHRLVPAYQLRSHDGLRFVIDASTGDLP